MDKYVNVNKIKAKVISGEPVLFSEATQHEIFFLLELEPSEDVEPVRHAHWIPMCKRRSLFADRIYECSCCGNSLDMDAVNAGRGDANYCPNCGARMDEETEK